jgi:hypothetical protein
MGLISNGTTLLDAGALDSGVATGAMILISTQTASNSATISFTSGIDSTYKEYIFKFINVHPVTNSTMFTFQVDTGTNTNYNQTITSCLWNAAHNEGGTESIFGYQTTLDQSQGTAFQKLANNTGNENDEGLSGTLTIFDPSNTTFTKFFQSRVNELHNENYSFDTYCAGYVNTTTAITRAQFKFESGNIDSGTIKLYGIK